MKVYVSFKSYLWNYKGYEPPIMTNTGYKIIDVETNKITENTIEEIEKQILVEEKKEFHKHFDVGSTEVVILGITKLDEEKAE